MTKRQVRVNIVANATPNVRRETIDGREKIVVSSATLPDNIVMNDIMYPVEEIEASYKTLDGTPAPLGHPHLSGEFVSASHTEAMIRFGIGAYNTNVRRENGRVLVDKVIDVEYAKNTDRGKRVLDRIDAGDPIHTSTGLVCTLENADEGAGYSYVARGMYFDHDAILLDEQGAAKPEQGVGMLVNSDVTKARHNGESLEVVNSEFADEQLEWIAREAVRVLDDEAKRPVVERVVSAIRRAFSGESETVSNEEEDMSEETKNLIAQVNEMQKTLDGLSEAVANAVAEAMKPVTDLVANMEQERTEREQAEKDELVNKLVAANDMDEETAKELSLNSLRRRVNALQTKKTNSAAPLVNGSGRVQSNDDTGESRYVLPEG